MTQPVPQPSTRGAGGLRPERPHRRAVVVGLALALAGVLAVALGITAATATPTVLRYPTLPHRDRLHDDVVAAPGYYSDPLGAADWRRATTATLAEEIRTELSGAIR